MGPRSDNRGYLRSLNSSREHSQLQWVHGPITVVILMGSPLSIAAILLQWVHGPITVVIYHKEDMRALGELASMGPRSDNRGYPGG